MREKKLCSKTFQGSDLIAANRKYSGWLRRKKTKKAIGERIFEIVSVSHYVGACASILVTYSIFD